MSRTAMSLGASALPAQRALALLLVLAISSVQAGRITTGEIRDETLNPATLNACLDWAVIGICVWLRCGPFGCRIRTSPLYAHYNPDLVNSGYHRVGENPWVEMAAAYGSSQKAVGQGMVSALLGGAFIGEGDRADDKYHRSHKDLRFKEADAIGNPVLTEKLLAAALAVGITPAGWNPALGAPRMCPKETKPFFPYLLSTLDFVSWRLTIPEMLFPEALRPGIREIGRLPVYTWQAVYPRGGFALHTEDPRAGAIVAQRAGDIVTRLFQPHVYLPTEITRQGGGDLLVFYPGPLFELRCETGKFQMLVPLPLRQCEVFGRNDLVTSWGINKSDEEADYAWNLWRPYQCCEIKGQKLISVIHLRPWPTCFNP